MADYCGRMSILNFIYRPSLALLSDLYQLTMAYGYWKTGPSDREAVFHLTFRRSPFHGGYTVAAGLATAIDYLENSRFTGTDVAYLATLTGNDGGRLFEPAFLDFLRTLESACDIDAVPEGTVVFPHEPLLRVRGPLLEAQLLETALLNIINFQTLIATKASRLVLAARGQPVLEFGLRRAQGIDGALSASRAAYIGGCDATSNVLAGQLYGIPVRGTHAHSWVMCHDDELTAFREYARVMPNNCVFLVDTYDTLQGVRHAVIVGQELRKQGHEMIGIRLDSGDLASLSVDARRILDEGGFPKASIVASNDLDERIVETLKDQDAKIDIWGVGTRLVTGCDDPALGGVYKLSAVRRPGEAWQYKVKLSEQAAKVSTPGVLQVRRFYSDDGIPLADAIIDENAICEGRLTMVDPLDMTRRKTVPDGSTSEDLLVPVFRGGRRVYKVPDLESIRRRAAAQLARFPVAIKRFVNPHEYFVGLERGLHERKTRLILQERGFEH
ncbi:MAG: nicotinate phosphoribosyltransferase [Thermoguttaceae bacterium]